MNKLIIAFLLAFSATFASAEKAPTPANDKEWPLLVLAAHTFPPFQFKRNEEMVGPGMTIMKAICEEAKVRCIYTMGAFKEQYAAVTSGKADILYTFLLNASPERNALFIDSPPFLETWYSFFTSSTSQWQWTGNPRDLDNRTIGVYGPSGTSIIAQEVVALNPTAKLIMEPTNLTAFQQLIVGKYGEKSAIVANRDVGFAFLKSANISGPRWAGDIKLTKYGYGMLRTSPNAYLAPRLETAVLKLQAQGIIQRMLLENETPLVPAK